MADPKIKYDIEADVKGDASIQQLEGSLRELGQTLDGDLKGQANAAAAALGALGAKQQAVENFKSLRRETEALSTVMDTAAQKVDAIGAELPQATAATAQFTEAEIKARAAVASAKADLDEQRQVLVKLRDDFTGVARKSDDFKESQAQLRVTVKDLKKNLTEKNQELTTAAAATKQAERIEKELNTEYKNSVNAAREISTGLGAKNRALESSRSAMDAVGISTRNLAETERNLDTAVAAVRQEVLALAPAYRAAQEASNSSTQKQVQNQKTLRDGMTSISTQLQQIQQIATVALGGSFVGGLLKDVAATADEFKNLQARIKLATGEGPNFQSSFAGVTEIALRTNSALESTGTLFARITKAGQEAGLAAQQAQQQALGITETINQSVQLSGSSAEASNAAITQLIQGLQSGVLRGEEFNSVMEQAPRLAQALANGLNVSTGELRKMAEQGQLTSTTVIRALQSQSTTVAAEFDKLPATVGRALQNLSTQWTLYVGASDNGIASSANAAKVIDALSRNIDTLVSVLYAAGKAYAAIKIAGFANDLYKVVASTAVATTSVEANTVALAANTAAHRTNAAASAASAAANVASTAAGAGAAATTGTAAVAAAGKVGILGTAVKGLTGLVGGPVGLVATLVLLWPEIKRGGAALGEQAAKWMGYGKSIDQADKFLASFDATAKENAASLLQQAQAMEEAKNRQFELSKSATGLVANFGDLIKKGDSAAEAIGKIGKDFDLSKLPGIKDAAGVLDKLLADGKLTASEFQAAWAKALDGKDLAVFETMARAAFSGSKREAELLAGLIDASLRESIKRAGLDFENLKGGVSKVSQSAVNDTQTIIDGLTRLSAQGVDTGRVLTASLGKGISTADTQQALDLVIRQIEMMRAKLGETVTNGLLDQAKQKSLELKAALDGITPGIQSIEEAMSKLGVTTDASLKLAAKQSKESFDYIANSGKASARELGDGFSKAANDAIAANKGIAPSWVTAQAASRGYELQVDSAGKTTVRAMSESRNAVDGLGQSVRENTADLEKQSALMDVINAKYGQSKADRESKYGKVGGDPTKTSDGNDKNADGSAKGTFNNNLPTDIAFLINQRSAANQLTAADLGEAQAGYQQAKRAKDDMDAFLKLAPGAAPTAYIQSTNALLIASKLALEKVQAMTQGTVLRQATSPAPGSTAAPASSAQAPAPAPDTPPPIVQTPAEAQAKRLQAARAAYPNAQGSTAEEVMFNAASNARAKSAQNNAPPDVFAPEAVAERTASKFAGLKLLLEQGYKYEDLTKYEDGSFAPPGNYFYPGENERAAARADAFRARNGSTPSPSPQAATQTPPSTAQTITINLVAPGNNNATVRVSSQSDAATLEAFLRQLTFDAARVN